MTNIKKLHRKILLIGLFPPPITGQAVATQALFEELKKRDLDVDKIELSNRTNVESLGGKFMKIFENLSVFIIYLWKIPFGKKIVYISPAASTLGFFRDFPAITLSHLFGQKIVAHFHIGDYKTFVDSRSPFLQKWIVRTLEKVDKIILLAENIRPNFDIAPSILDKVTVISNGIPEPESTLKPKHLGSENDEIVLLFLSNMIQSKGYMSVLEATWLLVNKYNINVKTLFCGQFMTSPDDTLQQSTEEAETYFWDFVKEKQLQNNVSFMGVVKGSTKTEILEKAHIFILPTEYYIEGLPISIIESLSYGMPILATPHRGIPDLVIDGQTGFLISDTDKAAFIAEKINELKQNTPLYDSMSQAAMTHFATYFTADRHFDNVVSVLKELDTDL